MADYTIIVSLSASLGTVQQLGLRTFVVNPYFRHSTNFRQTLTFDMILRCKFEDKFGIICESQKRESFNNPSLRNR